MIKNVKIKIFGRVQGVWFRESAKKKAHELEINGWIRNEPDGSVYAEVDGEEELFKVEKVEIEEVENLKGYKDFEVRY